MRCALERQACERLRTVAEPATTRHARLALSMTLTEPAVAAVRAALTAARVKLPPLAK